MRNILLTSMLLMLLAVTGCQREANVQQIIGSEAQRREVYTAIMENPEMRTEMMQMMREHPQSDMMGEGGMMNGNHMMMGDSAGMMGSMNQENMQSMMRQMIERCETDTAACNMMSRMMMGHSGMMNKMMQRMHERGMVDEACMQQMMRNMGNGRR